MTTPFEQAAALSSTAVDTVYGESFQFIAMKAADDVDAPRVADTARPTFTAPGGYIGPGKSQLPHARGSVQDDNAHKIAAVVPYVSVDNRLMPWAPMTGDRAVRIRTGETFEISKPIPDGVIRTRFHLTARKR